MASSLDDQFLRSFDRRYRVTTRGHIVLSSTSFDPLRLGQATSYAPVNGWAFRRLLKILNLPKTLQFADLGCGLGRACIIAGEYGFEKVTGIELAAELCAKAQENVARCRLSLSQIASIRIVHEDVLKHCEHAEEDVFFMFRAFSFDLFQAVRAKLADRGAQLKKPVTIIYTERLNWPPTDETKVLSEDRSLRELYRGAILGQAFYVYRHEVQA
jgi:SAM-dependent methyltransferase